MDAKLVLEAAAGLAERRDAGEHVSRGCRVVLDAADVGDVGRAGGEAGRRAGAARGVLEDAVLAAVASQPAIDPSPAPMSVLMTAMWRSGTPGSALAGDVMNGGKLR